MSALYGSRLRSVREERGLRQVDVAVKLNMSAAWGSHALHCQLSR